VINKAAVNGKMMKVNMSALLKKIFITMVIIVCLTVVGFWFVRTYTEVAVPETEREIILLPELKWGSYGHFTREIQNLRQKYRWQVETPGWKRGFLLQKKKGLPTETMDGAMQLELTQRQALLADELKLRRRLLEMKIDNQVMQKQNQDKYRIKQALEEKSRQHAAELVDFQRQKEKEYSSKLATLFFQLELPDLALDERLRLETEITVLKQELAEAINQKALDLNREEAQFATALRQAATTELTAYRRKMEIESETEFLREQQELEAEFCEMMAKSKSSGLSWSEGAE
jgi:hypothetical protein